MRILVLGGYGMIGTVVVRRLQRAGHFVVGLGRSVETAKLRHADVTWRAADISRLTRPSDWREVLTDARPEAIVNCAGALQDGLRDDVAAVQARAITALIGACPAAGVTKFVQISAVRADRNADTVFMRSKGEADAELAASGLDWVVLRPGLVISAQAYGGTALLRALAAVPLVQPVAWRDTHVQTVDGDEVADAVADCLEGRVPTRATYDLVEDKAHSFAEVVKRFRGWHGFAPAPEIAVPHVLVRVSGRVADGLGWLGWRSPLRSTALNEIAAGVIGDPAPWRAVTGRSLRSLSETLARLPSTVQERWFARLFLLKPAAIAMLALFWIASGVIALVKFDAATLVLTAHGSSVGPSAAIVGGGALIDIVLGLAILVRRSMRRAALGMIAVTLGYLVGGTLIAPQLWLDPLGAFVKTLPAAMLAVMALALEDDR